MDDKQNVKQFSLAKTLTLVWRYSSLRHSTVLNYHMMLLDNYVNVTNRCKGRFWKKKSTVDARRGPKYVFAL